MKLVAAPPFRVGSLVWQEQPGDYTLTVVCKATYTLQRGLSPLALEPEDVNEAENYWDDDPQKGLYAPSDLAPTKDMPEVLLVGSAFAPRGEPVRGLAVRMVIGSIDKTMDLVAPPDAPAFTRMPLARGEGGFGPRPPTKARGGGGQSAPSDQRLAELLPDQELVLENLSPVQPTLRTRLAGVRPRARVEVLDFPSWELVLVADTLWIDTHRGVCTLTWRGQVPLASADAPGVVQIELVEPPLAPPPLLGADTPPPSLAGTRPPPPPPRRAPLPTAGLDEHGLSHDFADTPLDGSELLGAPRSALPFRASQPGVLPSVASARASASWRPNLAPSHVAVEPEFIGVLATPVPSAVESAPLSRPRAASASAVGRAPSGERATLLSLVWCDVAECERLRETAAFADLFASEAGSGSHVPTADEDERRKLERARADVSLVLARGTTTTDVEGALFATASPDGVLAPPLCVVAGELELLLDDVETLSATLAAAAPLAVSDKKLKEVTDLAAEAAQSPLITAPGVAANLVARVREAWLKANRALPPDYLEVHVRGLLLEKRSYQRRERWRGSYLRAMLTPVGDTLRVPTYVPAEAATELPLFAKLSVRLVAEALPQQDPYDAHPVALRVVGLARVLGGRASSH